MELNLGTILVRQMELNLGIILVRQMELNLYWSDRWNLI